MNVNKIIYEAMGFKWRELTVEKREFKCHSTSAKFTDLVCKCCDGPQSGCKNNNPDYNDPVYYCKLLDWLKEEISNHSTNKEITTKRAHFLHSWLNEKFSENDFQFVSKRPTLSFWLSPIQEQLILIAEAIEAGVLK